MCGKNCPIFGKNCPIFGRNCPICGKNCPSDDDPSNVSSSASSSSFPSCGTFSCGDTNSASSPGLHSGGAYDGRDRTAYDADDKAICDGAIWVCEVCGVWGICGNLSAAAPAASDMSVFHPYDFTPCVFFCAHHNVSYECPAADVPGVNAQLCGQTRPVHRRMGRLVPPPKKDIIEAALTG